MQEMRLESARREYERLLPELLSVAPQVPCPPPPMALQDEQQIRTASSDNHSLVTANIHSDRLPRSSLQPTALNAAALQEKDPIERQEEFKMQVLKEPKCGPTWSGLEEQVSQVGSPGGAQSSSTPTVSSHQQKALGLPCFSHLRRQRVSTVYHGSLISICLCLLMPMLATALQAQGPCSLVMDILDGNPNVSCKLKYPQNVENIQKLCSKFPDSPVVYLCTDMGNSPEKAMTEYAGWPVTMEGSEMCNRSMILLTFLNNSWHSNCIFKNGNSSSVEQKVEDGESILMRIMLFLVVIGMLIPNVFCKNNWWKNRCSKSQPSPCHRTSKAIQHPYAPAPNSDPEDDVLLSVAIDGNADTATATVDTHDAVPGETSANPTKDPYPTGIATMDTFLTADSESVNTCNSAYLDCRGLWLYCHCLFGC